MNMMDPTCSINSLHGVDMADWDLIWGRDRDYMYELYEVDDKRNDTSM